MATIMQVAQETGVSASTVSRILNDVPGYTYPEETRQRVVEAAQRLKYQASPVARALLRSRTNVVAIAVGEPDDYHYALPLRRAHALASARGMTTTLVLRDSGVDLETILERGQADVGLVARGTLEYCERLLEALVASHQMVVGVGANYGNPLPEGVRTAYWEDREGLRQGLEHLKTLGHRDVTYLEGYLTYLKGVAYRGKIDIVREEAQRLGLGLRNIALETPASRLGQGAEMGRRALQMRPRPTALFARTDEIALGAIHAICEAGLRVPEDISIMGHFDIPFAAYSNPPLTTIRTPLTECFEDVLQAALEALQTGCREALEPKNVRFSNQLICRRSTAPPA